MEHYIKEMLGLKGVTVEKVENGEKTIKVYVSELRKAHVCSNCGHETERIHDYYVRKIKYISIDGKQVILMYKQRRYKCSRCGKNITEQTELIGKHSQISKRVVETVINRLRDVVTFKQAGKENHISTSSVIRYFDFISYKLTGFENDVVCIDEFKGNADGIKYQAALVDPIKKKVINVYSQRYKHHLQEELLKIPRAERAKIKYFITDMWDTYIDIGNRLFPNATVVIDRFHYVKVFTEAMQKMRKQVQSTFGKEIRKYFKHSRRILLCRKEKLKEEKDKERLEEMLSLSRLLRVAYGLLQKFYEFSQSREESEAKEKLKEVYDMVENSKIQEFDEALKTITRYQKYILNSFKTPYTNAYAEGQNNMNKVIKRVSFGYRNGKRFGQRILHHATV